MDERIQTTVIKEVNQLNEIQRNSRFPVINRIINSNLSIGCKITLSITAAIVLIIICGVSIAGLIMNFL